MQDDTLQAPATIFDIAARAGVSIATADRALNGRKGVAEKTREAVLEAARALDWTPNPIAQSLSRKSVVPLDVILPEPSSPFMDMLVRQVSGAAERFRAFRMAPTPVLVPELDVAALAEALLARKGRPQGVALVGLQHPDIVAAIDALVASGTPVVTLVSDVLGTRRTAYVGVDNTAAGRAAAVMAGRFTRHDPTPVMVLAGTALYTDIREREAGFRALAATRFPHLHCLPTVWDVETDAESRTVARDLLHARPDIGAIYVAGGGQAGVAQAVEAAGRADEIVIVAHDVMGPLEDRLRAGTFDAAINQNPEMQVVKALDLLSRLGNLALAPTGTDHSPIDIRIAETLPA